MVYVKKIDIIIYVLLMFLLPLSSLSPFSNSN